MPNNNSNKKDDKNYHAQMKRLEKQASKLGNQLQSLQQGEKASRSVYAKKTIKDKIKKLERANAEKVMEMMHLDARYKQECLRREKCKIPSSRCPLAPLRPAQ